MKVFRPLLLIGTPLTVAGGLYEGWRLAGGLVFLMAALILGVGFAIGSLVFAARREHSLTPPQEPR